MMVPFLVTAPMGGPGCESCAWWMRSRTDIGGVTVIVTVVCLARCVCLRTVTTRASQAWGRGVESLSWPGVEGTRGLRCVGVRLRVAMTPLPTIIVIAPAVVHWWACVAVVLWFPAWCAAVCSSSGEARVAPRPPSGDALGSGCSVLWLCEGWTDARCCPSVSQLGMLPVVTRCLGCPGDVARSAVALSSGAVAGVAG